MNEMRWAARYAFCDPLWRGRARLIVDAELVASLRRAVRAPEAFDDAAFELLTALVPREPGVPVWVVVDDDASVRALAPHFGGTRFVALGELDDRIAKAPWEAALITLGGTSGDATIEATILGDVAAGMGRGRVAAIASVGEAADYETFVGRVRPLFGEPRVYGGYAPHMLAFAEFTSDTESESNAMEVDADLSIDTDDDERWVDDDTPDAAVTDDAIPLAFDNTLGPADPAYVTWIAVFGDTGEFAEGLTLVELPPGRDLADADDMRRQWVEARRLAESGALERQSMIERTDALEHENADLRATVAQLREQLAGAVDAATSGERLDAALCREQTLKWRISALEREVAALRVRPVDELSAELERVRAQLETARGRPSVASSPQPQPSPPVVEPSRARMLEILPTRSSVLGLNRTNPDVARRLTTRMAGSGRTGALRVVEGIARRVEHGTIERTALRRELAALRRRLRT